MFGALVLLSIPFLVLGLIWLAVSRTRREQAAAEQSAAAAAAPKGPWRLSIAGREHGPFGLPQLQGFREKGLIGAETSVTDTASGAIHPAGDIADLFPEPLPTNVEFQKQVVTFQTFGGQTDPVRLGKGQLWIQNGTVSLFGRRRALFSIRKREERIALDDIIDACADGKLVRFRVAGQKASRPRLVQFSSPALAKQFADALPVRLSQEGAQTKADTEAFARFLADGGRPYVTQTLIAANLLVYVLCGLNGAGWMTGNPARLIELGGNFSTVTTGGEWWRLASAMFLHSGLLHVVMNMACLWDSGRVTEHLFGRWRFLLIYVAAGLVGSIASINWQQESVSVGASGAVFGVYAALAAALALNGALLPPTVAKRLRSGALIFMLFTLLNGFGKVGIDNAAHLGGLIAGAILGAGFALQGRRSAVALAVVTSLFSVASVRAVELAIPVRDELAFRQFLNTYANEEARLNNLAKNKLTNAAQLPPKEIAQRIDQELLPGWVSLDQKISTLSNVSERSRRFRDPMANFIHLRREAMETMRDGLLTGNEEKIALAMNKIEQANKVAESLKTIAEEAAGKKGGQK
jgi:rhomboid protease GluP